MISFPNENRLPYFFGPQSPQTIHVGNRSSSDSCCCRPSSKTKEDQKSDDYQERWE